MAINVRNEGAKVNSNINVTPMVDVMLVLLIIFMVITPMLHKGVDVDMAKVNNPSTMQDADKDDALIVAVQRDGKVFFGSEQMPADQLTQKIKDKLASRTTNKTVFLRADARAKYKVVADVVDTLVPSRALQPSCRRVSSRCRSARVEKTSTTSTTFS